MPDADPLQAQAAQAFAVELAAGRLPPVRAIRARLHVGQPRAQRVRAYLAALNGTQAGASLEYRAGISEVRSAALRDPPTSSTKTAVLYLWAQFLVARSCDAYQVAGARTGAFDRLGLRRWMW
jgi:hypothetical protein